MSYDWVQKLKVPELKDELKKRGLPISGLKQVLVDRLLEFLNRQGATTDQVENDPGQAVEATDPTIDEPEAPSTKQSADLDEEKTNLTPETTDVTPELATTSEPQTVASQEQVEFVAPLETALLEKAPAGDLTAGLDEAIVPAVSEPATHAQPAIEEVEASSEPAEESAPEPGPPVLEAAGLSVDAVATAVEPIGSEDNAAAGTESIETAVHEEEAPARTAVEAADSVEAAVAEPAPEPAAVIGEQSRTDLDELVGHDYEAEVDYEMDAEPEAETTTEVAPTITAAAEPTGKRSNEAADVKEDEGPRSKRTRVSGEPKPAALKSPAEPSPRSAVDRPTKMQRADSGRAVRGAGTPSRAMCVEPFVRPLREKEVRELLVGFGAIEDFWMPALKTHCLVVFETQDAALAAYTELLDKEWQPSRKLRPRYLGVEETLEEIGAAKSGGTVTTPTGPSPAAARADPAAPPARRAALAGSDPAPEAAAPRPSGDAPASAKAPAISRLSQNGVPRGADPPAAAAPALGAAAARRQPPAAPEPPKLKTLDDLFRRTKTQPALYYVVLSDEEVAEKKRKAAAMPARPAAAAASMGNGTGGSPPSQQLPPPPALEAKVAEQALPPPPSRDARGSGEKGRGSDDRDNGRPRRHEERGQRRPSPADDRAARS